MLLPILIAVAAIVLVFGIVAALQPSAFRLTRSIVVSAPPEKVFAEVNDLHRWQAWSPWAKLDPAAKNAFEGPSAGVGAVFMWSGNSQVGEGKMTVVESRPGEKVVFRLDFEKPFKATNTAEFTFVAGGGGTAVSWTMSGTRGFLFKAVGLVLNCDKMVAAQFDRGLGQLKAVSEAA